jgi:hypothetical protein
LEDVLSGGVEEAEVIETEDMIEVEDMKETEDNKGMGGMKNTRIIKSVVNVDRKEK